ncbi:ricin-type beta-trefoil lectin domain protein [Kitasatospora indigofera]|uniref:ricin-type beta-trefoil lectin domain protein n=1 Tax=Kitasatospora indigofera TaxID=67307 RepID=UPI00363644DE
MRFRRIGGRGLVPLLVGGLALSVAGIPAAPAGAAAPRSDSGQSAPAAEAESARQQAARTGQPVELLAARSETSEQVVNPDGSHTVTQHLRPVRIRTGGGWTPVDPTLKAAPDGTVRPAASAVDVAFSGGGGKPLITLAKGPRRLSISWPDALPAPTLDGATATYPAVLPDVDLKVTATGDGYTQVLVVKTRQAALDPRLADLRFRLDSQNVAVSTGEGGGLEVKDTTGATVWAGPSALMWDSRGDAAAAAGTATKSPAAKSPAAEGTAPAAADGAGPAAPGPQDIPAEEAPDPTDRTAHLPISVVGDTLEVKPDARLLTAADTEFPLVIDPSVTAFGRQAWTRVDKSYPNQAYWNANDIARVGHEDQDGGTSRSFFQMDSWNFTRPGVRINSARFEIVETHAWSCSARPVELWWTGAINSGTNWNNQPGWGGWSDTQNVAKGNEAHGCGDDWVYFNAYNAVMAGVQYQSPSLTLGLRASNESDTYGWKKFDNNPRLVVNYNYPPDAPTAYGTNPSTVCATTATGATVLGATTGTNLIQLQATVSDPQGDQVRAHFWLADDDTNTLLTDWTSGFVNSGSPVSFPIPAQYIPTDRPISLRWQVRAEDGTDASAGVPAVPCHFKVDPLGPKNPPAIASPQYPAQRFGAPAGTPTNFTLNGGGDPDVVKYVYSYDTDSLANTATTTSGGLVTLPSYTPAGAGLHTLYAASVDPAGNRSSTAAYRFYPTRPATAPKVAGDFDNDGYVDLVGTVSDEERLYFYKGTASVDNATGLVTSAFARGTDPLSAEPPAWQSALVARGGDYVNDGVPDQPPAGQPRTSWDDGAQDVLAIQPAVGDPTRRALYLYANDGGGPGAGAVQFQNTMGTSVVDPKLTAGAPFGWADVTQLAAAGDIGTSATSTAKDNVQDLLVVANDKLYAIYGRACLTTDGECAFSAPQEVGNAGWNGMEIVRAVDLTGDGNPDLIARSRTSTTDGLRMYPYVPATGATSLGAGSTRVPLGTTGWGTAALKSLSAPGDLDLDGKVDLVGITVDGAMRFWHGDGANGFSSSVSSSITGIGNKCVDIAYAQTDAILFTCLGGGNQHWTWNNNSLMTLGKCLDITVPPNSNPLGVLAPCNGSPAQQWLGLPDGHLQNRGYDGVNGVNWCLASPGSSTADNTRLILWQCMPYTDQVWQPPVQLGPRETLTGGWLSSLRIA